MQYCIFNGGANSGVFRLQHRYASPFSVTITKFYACDRKFYAYAYPNEPNFCFNIRKNIVILLK